MTKANNQGLFIEPLMTRPEKVAIVALGGSAKSFIAERMSNNGIKNNFDEVWTLNRGLRAYPHDKLFVMDDLKWIEDHNKAYADFLKKHDKPIITSTVYDDYPMAVEYPLQYVMETIEDDIFAVNTVSYMVAYAIHIGVKEVSIYGADFFYPNGQTAEAGGQAVAYLCGMMRKYGMVHRIPGDSTLLYANKVKMRPDGGMSRELYGYHRKGQLQAKKDTDKKLKEMRKGAKV
jgi:hypothetical protein